MLGYCKDFVRFARAARINQPGHMALLVGGGLLMSLLELAGLYALLPLMRLMMQPDYNSQLMQRFAGIMGIASHNGLVLMLGLLVAAVFIFKNLFQVFYQRYEFRQIAAWRVQVVGRFYRAYQQMAYEDYLQTTGAQVVSLLSNAIPVALLQYVDRMLALANYLLTLGLILGFVMYVNWKFFFTVGAVTGLLGGICVLLMKRQLRQISKEAHALHTRQQALLQQSFGGYREVRVYHKERFFTRQTLQAVTRMAQAEGRLQLFQNLPPAVIELLMMCLIVAVFESVLLTSKNIPEALAELGVLVLASMRLMPLLTRSVAAFTMIQGSHGLVQQVLAEAARLGMHAIDRDDPAGGMGATVPVAALGFTQEIKLQQVGYTYPRREYAAPGEGKAALSGIELVIKPGQFIGITGPSGGGKSTLVNVLLGLVQPQVGTLTVDGVAITPGNVQAFHQLIGLVDQQIFVLNGTVAENIAFGLDAAEIDLPRVQQALERAQLWETVQALPQGLATAVGENGGQLSGGQRQRLVIARAFYRDLKLLILDEASAALDVATEHELFKTLEQHKGALAVVMIAHRLATLQNCDKVFFLKEGRVADSGTFAELYESSAEFKKYITYSQMRVGGTEG